MEDDLYKVFESLGQYMKKDEEALSRYLNEESVYLQCVLNNFIHNFEGTERIRDYVEKRIEINSKILKSLEDRNRELKDIAVSELWELEDELQIETREEWLIYQAIAQEKIKIAMKLAEEKGQA
jgi:hypothetical protein